MLPRSGRRAAPISVLCLLLGVAVVVLPAPRAEAAIAANLTNVPVRIKPVSAPAQCMDAMGTATSTPVGTTIQQYACQPRYQYNQVLQFVPQSGTSSYSLVIQSSKGQLDFAGVPATPLCVALANTGGSNGTRLVAATCAFSSSVKSQLWNVSPASGGAWTIASASGGRCIDVPSGSTSSGVALQVWDCSGVPQQRWTVTRQSYPTVGIIYQSWFDYGTTSLGCAGQGWADGPFGTTPGSATVKSLSFGAPTCYSSKDPSAAQTHAGLLSAMGVSFILIDDTNFGKTRTPAANGIYQASKQVTAGISSGPTPLKVAYMLSLTCWQQECYNAPGNNPAWNQKEMVIWRDAAIKAELEDIAARYAATPSRFQTVNGKPLIVFYVNGGSNVYCPRVPPAELQAVGFCPASSYSTLTQAFNGPANITPSTSQFDPFITVGGVSKRLSEVFTVRFGVFAANAFDYTPYDSRIWPMYCAASCVSAESGYTAVAWNASQRSWSQGENSIVTSLAANSGTASYMIVSAWNEFSSTDEYTNHAYTLEPNTYLHTVPGDESGGDPWYFFNKYKSTFLKWR